MTVLQGDENDEIQRHLVAIVKMLHGKKTTTTAKESLLIRVTGKKPIGKSRRSKSR
jgi:hypothetical protein